MKQYYFSIVISLFSLSHVVAQFGPPQLISLPEDPSSDKQYIRTADIDRDGKLDILVGSNFSEIIRIFRNEGNFTFSPPTLVPASWESLRDIQAVDLNADNAADIISVDIRTGNLYWHPNLNGAFPLQVIIAANLELVFTRIVCEDFNNDGHQDIVILNHTNALLFLNNGAGNFATPLSIIPVEDETEFYDHVTGDFNGDGFMDLAITSGGFDIYLNDGTGHFTKTRGGGINISFLIECGDYNNDGLDDIIMSGHQLVPYMNSPSGFSIVSEFSPNNENYQTIFSSDLDNDGDLDVLSEDNQTNAFFWYENVDGGSSWIRHTISIGLDQTTIFGVRAADLDGDGDNDLIRSSTNGDVAIYENQLNLTVGENTVANFVVYPNPAVDQIYISNQQDIESIEIYDVLGKSILKQVGHGNVAGIDITAISVGHYFLKITTGKETAIKQLVVAR